MRRAFLALVLRVKNSRQEGKALIKGENCERYDKAGKQFKRKEGNLAGEIGTPNAEQAVHPLQENQP